MLDTTKPHGVLSPLLRVLLLDDSPRDAKLMVALLESGGNTVQSTVLDTPESYRERLEIAEYDVILADFNLCNWSALDALEILKRSGKDIPLIVLTGALDDIAAVECLKQGAVDYVQKDRLARLPNTVQRVLEEKRLRTENKRAEEALRRASAHDRTLVEASLDPLVFISPAGRISDVNEATVKLTGVPREKLIGTDFSSYFTEPERARAVYRKVFEKGFVTNYELTIRHVEGHLTHVLYNASVYTDTEGSALGVFAAARDITERKRAEGKIQKLNEQLEQRVRERTAELESANKELEAFTYSVSHDLRAPLRHVEGFSKLLVEKHRAELSPDVQEYLATIRDSVLQMGRLIDDLLNLARVGRTQLSMQATGLNSLVEEVRTDLDRANPERLIAWKIETLPFVECDPALIKQVFANLLSNAVKFTRPRKPALIEVGVASQDGARAVFVRDNGVGFSMKYAHKLFGVFQRLHREEDFEGTGVGLATVQRIIHKHGGRVWAEAELDKGATFYFTLGSSDDPQPEEPTDSGGNA